jgi:hypothetical protein
MGKKHALGCLWLIFQPGSNLHFCGGNAATVCTSQTAMNRLSTIELHQPDWLPSADVAAVGSDRRRFRKRLHGIELPSSDLAQGSSLV